MSTEERARRKDLASCSPEGLQFACGVPEALTQQQHPRVSQIIEAQVQLCQALVHIEGGGQVFTGGSSKVTDLQPAQNPTV
jgi:hypothetical protein